MTTLSRLGTMALLVLIMALPSAAYAYIYFGEDSGRQETIWSGTENWIHWRGATRGEGTVVWSDSQLVSYVDKALDLDSDPYPGWKSAAYVFQPWSRTTNESEAELKVVQNNSLIEDRGAYGLFWWLTHESDTVRNANYMKTFKIEIDLEDLSSYPNLLQYVVSHELGHAIGLHDAYGSGGSCNGSRSTVMDGSSSQVPCDSNSPTSEDSLNVSNAYGWGRPASSPAPTNTVQGGSLVFRWYDAAWGEYSHLVHLYWWNGSIWEKIAGPTDVYTDIGVHKDLVGRQLEYTFGNVQQYGKGSGYYNACSAIWNYWDPDNDGSYRSGWECGSAVWMAL